MESSDRTMRRRVMDVRDRVHAQFERWLNAGSVDEERPLMERFEVFRQQEGGGPLRRRRRGTTRPRLMTIKVSVFHSGDINMYRSHRDANPPCRVVVPLDLSAAEFRQALMENVDQMPENYEMCKVNGQRNVIPLQEKTPREIKESNALGRSNLYIRPKTTEANEVLSGQFVKVEMAHVQPLANTQEESSHEIQDPVVVRVLPDTDSHPAGSIQEEMLQVEEVNREEFYIDSDFSEPEDDNMVSPVETDFNEEADLATVLGDFRKSNLDDSEYCTVIARRKNILQSAYMALSRSFFRWHRKPNVEFVGEMADDYGGPGREFFRLLMIEVQTKMGIFEGIPGNLVFCYSQQKLSSKKYFTAGRLTAWSIMHNGPGPRCLNKELFLMMCGQKPCLQHLNLDVFLDEDTNKNVQKVSNCTTLQDLADLKSGLGEWIANCGIPDIYAATLQDLPRIRDEVFAHFVFHRAASMINQFTEGMDSCGNLWQMVKRFWKQFLPVFTNNGQKLTRQGFQNLFTIAWSPAGSNRLEEEEATIFQWEWWLMAIAEKEVEHTYKEVLVFVTGADCIPPLGFPQSCTLDFYDQEPGTRRVPYSSTCSMCLFLPRGVQDESAFKDMMYMALKGSLGFGKV